MGGTLRNFGAGLVVMASLALCAPSLAAENEIRMPVDKSATPDPLGEMMQGKKPAPEKKPEADKPADQKVAEDKKGAAKRLEPDGVARGEAKKPGENKPEEKKPEPQKAEPQKPEQKKAEPKKPEPKKADEKQAEAHKPAPAAKPATPKPVAPKPVAAKPVAAKAEQQPAPAKPSTEADNATALAPAPKPEAKPAPAPKPAPKPYVDPVAFVMPTGPAGGAPAHVELPAGGLLLGDLSIEFQHTQLILRAATSREVDRVTFFYLKDLRRLAVDLRGDWRRKGPGALRYDTGPVKHVVTGEHPDRLRLVLEFREGAVRPDLEPVIVREPGGGLTVTIPLAR